MAISKAAAPYLRWGCLVAVVLFAVTVVWVVILAGSAYLATKTEEVAQRELRPVVTAPSGPAGEDAPLGRVVLDFDVGEWDVRAAAPGEPLRVEAEFDTRSYELVESTEPGGPDGAGWTYRLSFGEKGIFGDGGLRALFGGAYPRVRVWLPRDVPLALEAEFSRGGADLELGGLWLTTVDIDQQKGSLDVGFAEPTRAPLASLTIRGRQGGFDSRRLGNASPARLRIDHRMGGSRMDLRGRWLTDSEVRISSSMGGSGVILPRGVRIQGLPGRGVVEPPSRPDELPVPTLQMSVSSSMGGMSYLDFGE